MTHRVSSLAVFGTAVAFALSGCGRLGGINSKGAVQAAIEAHLKQRPGLALANMSTDVQDVKFDGDKATAQVMYQSKDVPDLKVEVLYTLRRAGDHWEVVSSTPVGGMGGNPHGGVAVPPTSPPPGQSVPANPHGVSPQASH